MSKGPTQLIAATVGPLLTLFCTALVVKYVAVTEEPAKALGAALAAAMGFILAQGVDSLPARYRWWRKHFDRRAAFEGMWLQIHNSESRRAAVFSFLYDAEADKYDVQGDAFGFPGDHWAHWKSTQVFFSTGSIDVNYLFEGKTFETGTGEDRKGATAMSLDRATKSRLPTTGVGEVLHLKGTRTIEFRLRRITQRYLKELGLQFKVDDLSDFERRQELARAYFAHRQRSEPAQEATHA